ncbi:glyoxalase/bleomycin resistance/extradiol dioxygenase family protein [Phenylobacterium sp. SCN 70-31]|uniref:VOC family protein n=1 Tax=Phenylobacterium sp. SCN 70-31 TaxID=1660129 RepID=UPI000869E72A|nr:glyoxalase/bleomycin resistance/extradiol dioxygenase family protein [Phenylobacterium sp. SCN 70-31]ODT87280.1 MAG: glyoxalase [Phenylobacterium sp. SCN 70-31]
MSEALAAEMPKVETKGGVTPYLSLDGALKAAEFYVKAFGAEIAAAYPPDEKGRTMHVHLYVNGASVMLSDFFEEYGHGFERPQAFNLTLQVDDIDAWWTRAIAAGCTEVTPPQKMFWGDTYGQCADPFGVSWSMNQAAT